MLQKYFLYLNVFSAVSQVPVIPEKIKQVFDFHLTILIISSFF